MIKCCDSRNVCVTYTRGPGPLAVSFVRLSGQPRQVKISSSCFFPSSPLQIQPFVQWGRGDMEGTKENSTGKENVMVFPAVFSEFIWCSLLCIYFVPPLNSTEQYIYFLCNIYCSILSNHVQQLFNILHLYLILFLTECASLLGVLEKWMCP